MAFDAEIDADDHGTDAGVDADVYGFEVEVPTGDVAQKRNATRLFSVSCFF